MTDNRREDEILLIDLLLGRCAEDEARRARERLQHDGAFRRRHDDLRNTLAAVSLATEHEPPEDLADRTLARVRSARQTDALLAREQLNRRDVIRPTFSLRELGAIAGVVVLLGSIFGVSYRDARRRKLIAQCRTQVARQGAALQTYANQHNGYLPAAGGSGRRWLPTSGEPAVSNSAATFKLVRLKYIEPSAFQCPAVGGGTFAVKGSMTDFPAAQFVSYSFQYSLGTSGVWTQDPAISDDKDSMVILADSTPMFAEGRFRADRARAGVSDNHDGAGQNVLYLDMHAAFKKRPFVGVRGDNIYLVQGVDAYDGDETPAGPTDTFLLPAFSENAPGDGADDEQSEQD